MSVPNVRRGSARRSNLSFFVVPAAFVVVYLGARLGLDAVEPGSRAALALALLPVPAFAALIYAFTRQVRALDELGRRVQLEALAFAFPIALLVAFTAGLLDLAGFRGEGNWDLPRLWPLLLLPYWFGVVIAQRRYA